MNIKINARANGAEIIIFGPIGDAGPFERTSATADEIKERLDALGTVSAITVRLNSPGGNFFDGLSIYNLLREHRAEVTVRVEGLAASAASIIAMAGNKIIMGEGSFIMIHRSALSASGSGDELRAAAGVLDEIDQQMVSIYSRRTGIERARLLDMLSAETWLTAAEAQRLGFADQIEEGAVAASLDFSHFPNVPTRIAAMAKDVQTDPNQPAPTPDAVLARERERRTEIRSRFGPFTEQHRALLDECLDDPQVTAAVASEKLIAALAKTAPRISSVHSNMPTTASPGTDDFISAASDALLIRAGIRMETVHAAARDVAAMSLNELAQICVDNDRSAGTIWKREKDPIKAALSTSDSPLILEDAIHKSMRRGFEVEPASHRQWVRVQPVDDFRTQRRPILGSAPDLLAVAELGEYTHGNFSEDGTEYAVRKFGRIVSLSWETIKNDNLGVFLQRIPPAMGQAARRQEADSVYDMLAENSGDGPTMQDSVVLFHADHSNLASAQAAFDKAALSAGRLLLRKQTAVGGGLLSLVPRYLIVPAELETDAEILIAAATQHRTGIDANEMEGTASQLTQTLGMTPEWIARLELVVEPRLADGAFYLATTSDQVDTVELGVLDENMGGPVMIPEEEFNRDNLRWKVRHVHQSKFLDWRGIVKVPLA